MFEMLLARIGCTKEEIKSLSVEALANKLIEVYGRVTIAHLESLVAKQGYTAEEDYNRVKKYCLANNIEYYNSKYED